MGLDIIGSVALMLKVSGPGAEALRWKVAIFFFTELRSGF